RGQVSLCGLVWGDHEASRGYGAPDVLPRRQEDRLIRRPGGAGHERRSTVVQGRPPRCVRGWSVGAIPDLVVSGVPSHAERARPYPEALEPLGVVRADGTDAVESGVGVAKQGLGERTTATGTRAERRGDHPQRDAASPRGGCDPGPDVE